MRDAGADHDDLAAAFHECRDGSCACPTNEYDKVATISVAINDRDRQITVRLTAKAGQALDVSAIDDCVRHTLTHGVRERASCP